MIHAEIDRIDGLAPMQSGRRNADDRLTGQHRPDAMRDQQPHQREAVTGKRRQVLHARQGQRFVVRELESFDPLAAANFPNEGAHAAKTGVGIGEGSDQRAGIEGLAEQADVLHGVIRR